ncbi:MAG: CAP domain-containing protein [Candidatus Micrarchaeia archaeon]
MRRLAAYAFMMLILLASVFLLPALMTKPAAVKATPEKNASAPPVKNVPGGVAAIPGNATAGPGRPNITEEPDYSLPDLEKNIHALVNSERASRGLKPLRWNDGVAGAARDHSLSLALENRPLTEPDLLCQRPFIHHEGFDTGLYQDGRLLNRSIYYFSASGENIFITSAWDYKETAGEGAIHCPEEGLKIVEEYPGPDPAGMAEKDLLERTAAVKVAERVNWTYVEYLTQERLEKSIVQGWMDSPGHRANILSPDFDEAGIGAAEVNDFVIVTEVFIERVSCGYKGAPCCEDGDLAFCYEPWECDGKACGRPG